MLYITSLVLIYLVTESLDLPDCFHQSSLPILLYFRPKLYSPSWNCKTGLWLKLLEAQLLGVCSPRLRGKCQSTQSSFSWNDFIENKAIPIWLSLSCVEVDITQGQATRYQAVSQDLFLFCPLENLDWKKGKSSWTHLCRGFSVPGFCWLLPGMQGQRRFSLCAHWCWLLKGLRPKKKKAKQ